MISENERLDTLLRSLLSERPEYSRIKIPATIKEKRDLLRALMNVRTPAPVADDIMKLQDEELALQREEKGVVTLDSIPASPLDPRLRLWQGDITRLQVDAIVNAANSQMLGCFVPLHKCIDNAIHSAAGMELRHECDRIMHEQGHDEPTGKAKITPGYNLPAKWVIHTVGPIVYGPYPTEEDCRLLADCYRNCLALADEHGLSSIAFCCISTGEFRFPQAKAAEIAVDTVRKYLGDHPDCPVSAVVFNVFKDEDYSLYKKLLHYE
ncbi:protein-ADP-ribose hydrolase [uncultured Duncaniella sp.]|uniref:protein-ADP-ribose hydrolase n=1 Tax=uncultured Duncaniella sp. TaxID=2768039 RepID=UPI00260F7EA5|nr:protein-ADP-ribose hydrolase [uncultured Duncaniella sp.]